MRNLLYVIAVILVIIWLLGSFAYHIGSAFIHLLLVAAVVMLLINVFNRRKPLD